MGSEPPRIQSVLGFTRYNCRKGAAAGRRRTAMAAVKLAASFFIKHGIEAPAGLCPDVELPGRLDKFPGWLAWLAQLNHSEAVATLADSVLIVPDAVYRAVELEYNAGIIAAASTLHGLKQLEPGHLAHRIAGLKRALFANTPRILPVGTQVRAAVPAGTFYYIGAGVGCGIREVQQVCHVACRRCLTRAVLSIVFA